VQSRYKQEGSQKTGADVEDEKAGFARRLREVRFEMYGEFGATRLAEVVGVPGQTWTNYEMGICMPAVVVLRLLEATGVSPHWLLSGDGPRYCSLHPVLHPDSLN
jgi:hypothetical protein